MTRLQSTDELTDCRSNQQSVDSFHRSRFFGWHLLKINWRTNNTVCRCIYCLSMPSITLSKEFLKHLVLGLSMITSTIHQHGSTDEDYVLSVVLHMVRFHQLSSFVCNSINSHHLQTVDALAGRLNTIFMLLYAF